MRSIDLTDRLVRGLRAIAADEPLALRVRGACMAPLLADGATVRVRRARVYWPGDVVAIAPRSGGALAHRVLGYRWHRGAPALVTQADAATRPDAPVPLGRVLGRIDVPVPLPARARATAQLVRHAARALSRLAAR